ncbi:hypothetical protein SDC9_169047 [bioreactor metagenome]|uniref:Uncharacterized protein n=1 Tax=bioreactor metagenome TaxID=1076179 RepID=A0A645G432_9ZZZZ
MWVRCQQELHAVQIDGRVAQIPGQVHASNPLSIWRYANVLASDQRQGSRPVTTCIHREGSAVPGVQPIVIIRAIHATVRTGQFHMAAIYARIRLTDQNTFACNTQLTAYFVHTNHGKVPAWFTGSFYRIRIV